MLSAEGIQPLPEKLDSITNMPAPEKPDWSQAILRIIGVLLQVCTSFFLTFQDHYKADEKDKPFIWMKQCNLAFNMLKDKFCGAPILWYTDSSKQYTLFTDASIHGWAGVLTQEFETEVKGKVLKELHLVTYISGLFLWNPVELGSPHKRSLCNLPLSQETHLLHYRCRYHNQKWSPAPQSLLAQEHFKWQNQKLGSWIRDIQDQNWKHQGQIKCTRRHPQQIDLNWSRCEIRTWISWVQVWTVLFQGTPQGIQLHSQWGDNWQGHWSPWCQHHWACCNILSTSSVHQAMRTTRIWQKNLPTLLKDCTKTFHWQQ